MTGKSYAKTRVIISSKMLSPLANRKSFNDAAIAFRRSVIKSTSMPRLNANVSTKALSQSPSKGNTDGKKRTNKGQIPGVEVFPGGYRYNPNQKWEPGKVLQIHTSYGSRMNQRIQTPNWGWVDDYKNIPKRDNKKKPTIVKKKYKVNPKTNEIIEGSEVTLNPFTFTGKNPDGELNVKQLPGKTIGQIMRGASLLQTAARAVGVLTDPDGKLRCPPGTPAANQFTDAMGSNCFGFTASEIFDLAQRVAHEAAHLLNNVSDIDGGGLASGGTDTRRGSLLNTARGWRTLIGRAVEKASEIPWMSTDREDIQPSDWEIDALPEDFGWFKDGALRGRKSLRSMRARVKSLLDAYGIQQDENNFDKNSDLVSLCEKLRERGIMTTEFVGRPTTLEEWVDRAQEALYEKFGDVYANLPDDKKLELIRKELDLQFELERAMLSEFIMSYTTMPEHMRTVRALNWVGIDAPWEAQAAWNVGDGAAPNSGYTEINLNLGFISVNAQKYLPELLENERARLEAIGGGSESENAAALHDFLVSSYVYSKQTAALIGGTESFARHIMAHEISHTVQINAILGALTDEIARTGKVRFFDENTGKWAYISVSSISELSNYEINKIMSDLILRKDGVKQILPALQRVIDDAEKMRWLAGKYMDDLGGKTQIHQALEIMAELGALRTQGIIHGPDVDDALSWMDEYVDTRFGDERGVSDAEETSRFLDLITYAESNTPEEVSSIFNDPIWTDERIHEESRTQKLIDVNSMEDENEIIDFIADKEFEVEQLTEKVKTNPDDIEAALQLRDAREELSQAKKKWKETNPDIDNLVLQEKVKRRRDELDKLNPEDINKRNAKRDIDAAKAHADEISEDETVNVLAYLKKKLEDKSLSNEDRKKFERYVSIYRKAFADKKRNSGDTRNSQAIARELDKRINERISPPKPTAEDLEPEAMLNPEVPKTKTPKPKPIKTPKNEAAVTRHTEKEREKLFTESTAQERIAIVELSDPTDKPIADLLDADKRIDAINKIRENNDRVISLGYEPDETSHIEGSIENQLENILMPVLDVLERSELENSVEVETIINLTDSQIDGSDNNPISVDSLLTGRLIDGTRGKTVGKHGDVNSETGKIPHRVIIQAESGQRGYYPHWSDSSSKKPAGYEQKVVFPPGKLEIVERIDNPDGSKTLIARIVEQKTTEDVLDGILNGPDSENIQPGARVEIQRAVNRHIVDRRKRGISSHQKTTDDEKSRINTSTDLSFDELNSENGSFGTHPDSAYINRTDSEINSPDATEENVFGPIQTREERRRVRAEDLADITERLKNIFATGEQDDELGISPEDIDPEVIRILENSSPAEIEQILADEAEKLHSEIDSRPRDVMGEDDLDELLENTEEDYSYKPGEKLQSLFNLLQTGDVDSYVSEIGYSDESEEDPLIRVIQQIFADEIPSQQEIANIRSNEMRGSEQKPKPSFPTSRRPKKEDNQNKPDNNAPKPPADVDPDTGEIIVPEVRPEPVTPASPTTKPGQQKPRINPGVVHKSKYQRQRKRPTQRVLEVLKGALTASDAMNFIQGLITGGDNSYQGRTNEGGRFIQGHALSAFGTADLSQLTAEQIAWLIDVAIYESNKIKPNDRGTRDREVADNKARALSFIASALQDYLDIMYINANNGKAPYPRGDWELEITPSWRPDTYVPGGFGPGFEPSIPPGFKPSIPFGDFDGEYLVDPNAQRPIRATGQTINSDMIKFAREVARGMQKYVDYDVEVEGSLDADMSKATVEQLHYYADLMESEYFKIAQQYSPESIELLEKIVADLRDLAERKDSGLASGGLRGAISSRVARKLVSPLVDRLDADDETKERIKLIADFVAATAAKGPTAGLTSIAIEVARRGGRDVAEIGLQKLVESGKITEEQSKAAMRAVDRVAPDGLPEPVKEMLIDGYKVVDEFIDERVLTDENKQRIAEATDDAKEKLTEATDKAREAVGEAAKKAKEKTRIGLTRLKKKKEDTANIPLVDDVLYEAYSENDPFGLAVNNPEPTTLPQPAKIESAFDDPFESFNTPADTESSPQSSKPRFIRRTRRNEFRDSQRQSIAKSPDSNDLEYDPFAGLASGSRDAQQTSASGRRLSRRERKAGAKVSRTAVAPSTGSEGNDTKAVGYIPLSPQSVGEMIRRNPFSRKARNGGPKKINQVLEQAGVRWELQGQLMDAVDSVIDSSPGMKALVEKFGMPPIFFTDIALYPEKKDMFNPTGFKQGGWFGVSGAYLPTAGIIHLNPKHINDKEFLPHLIRHEMAHAFHAMAQARSKQARERMAIVVSGMISDMSDLARSSGQDDIFSDFDALDGQQGKTAISQMSQEMISMAKSFDSFGVSRGSTIAMQNPSEFVAEVIAYATSPNPSMRSKVSPGAFDIAADFFGMTSSELRELIGQTTTRFF